MDMYSNNFVVSVHVNRKPQNELKNGVVPIPFGSEYSIRLRNKHKDRRAVAKITIDGEEVSGQGIIIPANSHVDLERWIDKPVKFKFVSIDSPDAVDFGKNGDNSDKQKGVVLVSFFLEKETKPQTQEVHHHHHYPYYRRPLFGPLDPWCMPIGGPKSTLRGQHTSLSQHTDGEYEAKSLFTCSAGQLGETELKSRGFVQELSNISGIPNAIPQQELSDGCTVEGGTSNQTFRSSWIDCEDVPTVIRIFLQGYEIESKVQISTIPTLSKLDHEESELTDKLNRLKQARIEALKKQIAELEATG